MNPRHWLALSIGLMGAGSALAQDAMPKPVLWIEPRVGATLTASDNARLVANASQSEQALEITPGIRMVSNLPKIKGFFDYQASGIARAQNTGGDSLVHRLQSNLTLTAVDQWAYVDLFGSVGQERISAFGPAPTSQFSDTNQTQTANYRISPFVRGQLPWDWRYEARYGLSGTKSESDLRNDVDSHQVSASVVRHTGDVGVSLSLDHEQSKYSRSRSTESSRVAVRFSYAWSPQWQFGLSGGREFNDLMTLDRQGYGYAGIDMTWRPSPRTQLQASFDDRYFGQGHHISFEHRSARTVVRVSDVRQVSTSNGVAGDATPISLYQLVDTWFAGVQDPIARDKLVQQMLQQMQQSGDTLINRSYLVSQATLQRQQQVSVMTAGKRSNYYATYGRSNDRRLMTSLTVGDDFDQTNQVRSDSLSFGASHRFTPVTSGNVNYVVQRNRGDSVGQEMQQQSVSIGLNTQLGRRTVGGIQLQHTRSNRSVDQYSENALIGNLLHRF